MENITVCLRIRPTNSKDDEHVWKVENNNILNFKSKEVFSYDKIIEPDQTNEELFRTIVRENIENFIRGINVSIFAYGQTSTGKTFTMKGTNQNLNGIIPMSVKEIMSRLAEEELESNGNFKFNVKTSYVEIYNETVNDLLDSSKKNLEIRESLQRGVFINNLTEVPINSFDKAIQLLKQGENVRVTAETKLNEKSSRSHTIFKLALEVTRTAEGKQKTYLSQLNLIDLAGSENVSKAKTEGIRMKEGSNINKSLLALSNVIMKLSNNQKSFVNYRDSKLTRLLQPVLSGNSKTMIICTITEAFSCYSETLNTLHFGIKAKNIKTSIKVNEMLDEKSKIMQENTQLKGKIKQLEEMIQVKKTTDKVQPNINPNVNLMQHQPQNDSISALEKEVQILKKILNANEDVTEADFNSVNNENMSTTSNNHFYTSAYNNNGYNNNNNSYNAYGNMSATKFNPRSSMLMSSDKKMTDSARKIYRREDFSGSNLCVNNFNDPNDFQSIQSNNSSSIFRRCMTDMKQNNFAPSIYSNSVSNNNNNNNNNNMNMNMNNYLLNTQQKNKYAQPSTNTFSLTTAYKPNNSSFDLDHDFLYSGQNDGSFQLLKENDELRKNIYELRKNFLETVQNKEGQIKSLNFYLNSTNENCEKIIREAEDNYMNLKLVADRTKDELLNKETEIKNMNQTIRSLEAGTTFHKEEVNRVNNEMIKLNESFKGDKAYRELEAKMNEAVKNYENIFKSYEKDKTLFEEIKTCYDKLKHENSSTRMQLENYKSENLSFKTQYDVMKKNSDLLSNENSKLKNDIESYKNEIAAHKDKVNKMKSEVNQLNKEKSGALEKDKKAAAVANTTATKELEAKIVSLNFYIAKLESQIEEYKSNLIKIEQTQILEYQKLLDESFNKIAELQIELENSNEKNVYNEKVINNINMENNPIAKDNSVLVSQTPLKENKHTFSIITEKVDLNLNSKSNQHVSQFSFVEKIIDKDSIPVLSLREDFTLVDNIKNDNTSPNRKDFIGKKRKHLTRVYQNIIDKNLNNKPETANRSPKNENKIMNMSIKEEKENMKDIYFSTYEM